MQLFLEKLSNSHDSTQFKKDFLGFPYILYPDLKIIPFEIESFYFKFHQFPHEFYLIRNQSEIVARFMFCESHHDNINYFGLLDFDLNSDALKDAVVMFKKIANEWGASNSSKRIIGPINFSTWLPYRLFSFSDGGPVFSFEPDRPIEYVNLLKAHGLSTNQLFSSKCFSDIDMFINHTNNLVEKLILQGFRFTPFNNKLSSAELKSLYDISIECFSSNYLASPIDFNTFSALYVANASKDDLSFSHFCYSPDGQLVAFFLAFVEHDCIVAKTVGVIDSHRGLGLSNALMNFFLTKAKNTGITKMIAAMVKEGAQSESYGKKMNLNWTHLYEILEF